MEKRKRGKETKFTFFGNDPLDSSEKDNGHYHRAQPRQCLICSAHSPQAFLHDQTHGHRNCGDNGRNQQNAVCANIDKRSPQPTDDAGDYAYSNTHMMHHFFPSFHSDPSLRLRLLLLTDKYMLTPKSRERHLSH